MLEPTAFQVACNEALRRACDEASITVGPSERLGEREFYFRLQAGDWDVFIYEDGAEFRRGNVSRSFEHQDYADLDSLREAFIAEALAAIQSN